jgi:hypothetical protein
MNEYQRIIKEIFNFQDKNGCWKMLSESDKYYPDHLHYAPNFKATLWTLILLADICHDNADTRVKKSLKIIKDHFYDPKNNIYSLKKDKFPIPCLNGNIIYLESYFNSTISEKSLKTIEFFNNYQRFDDGKYITEKNKYCTNTSCYGQHTCYWGIVKLFKGLSFIPKISRNRSLNELLEKCINFILLHNVCFSSHRINKMMIKDIDKLTFPNMYKSDYLEILWLLKRENVRSENLNPAIDLLKSKRSPSGNWKLEKKVNNMITSIGNVNQSNQFVTKRAKEVLDFYNL